MKLRPPLSPVANGRIALARVRLAHDALRASVIGSRTSASRPSSSTRAREYAPAGDESARARASRTKLRPLLLLLLLSLGQVPAGRGGDRGPQAYGGDRALLPLCEQYMLAMLELPHAPQASARAAAARARASSPPPPPTHMLREDAFAPVSLILSGDARELAARDLSASPRARAPLATAPLSPPPLRATRPPPPPSPARARSALGAAGFQRDLVSGRG